MYILRVKSTMQCGNFVKATKLTKHFFGERIFSVFHTEILSNCFVFPYTVWKLQKFSLTRSTLFRKNFVKTMVLLKKLLNSWFDEIFFQWERISRFSTVCRSDWFFVLGMRKLCTEILSHNFLTKISWKQRFYYSNKLLKSWFQEIIYRWEKISEISTLCNFHSVSWKLFNKNSVETIFQRKLISRNFSPGDKICFNTHFADMSEIYSHTFFWHFHESNRFTKEITK